jgi:UDP-2-acetamido-3-amino-2,3-dideoxy-glucuronate N-acetyltransferase
MKSLAVVGCGLWGKNLARNFAHLGLLRSVCDLDMSRSQEIAAQWEATACEWEDLLKDPHILGIALATPASTHISLAQQAIAHGKHIFLEKPAALNSKDLENLVLQAKEAHSILMVGHLMRYHPAFIAAQRLVLSGTIGDLVFIEAYRQNFGRLCPGEKNVFWSLSCHDISMILALTDSLPTHISASAQSLYTSADQGAAQLYFEENNIVARITASWIAPQKDQRLILIGTKGTLVFEDSSKNKLTLYPHHLTKDSIRQEGPPSPLSYDQQDQEPLAMECRHFWESIVYNRTPRTNGDEALNVTRVLEDIDKALDDSR